MLAIQSDVTKFSIKISNTKRTSETFSKAVGFTSAELSFYLSTDYEFKG